MRKVEPCGILNAHMRSARVWWKNEVIAQADALLNFQGHADAFCLSPRKFQKEESPEKQSA